MCNKRLLCSSYTTRYKTHSLFLRAFAHHHAHCTHELNMCTQYNIVQNAHGSCHGTTRHSSLLDLLRSAFSLSLVLSSSLMCPVCLAAPLELAHWIWAETTEWHKPKSRMFSGHLFYWFLCILFDLIKLWTTISDVCASSNCSAQFRMKTHTHTHTRAAPFIHSFNAHTCQLQ